MDLRANAARNLDEFHEAFGVAEGDGMWLAPERPGPHLLTRAAAGRRMPSAPVWGRVDPAARMTG